MQHVFLMPYDPRWPGEFAGEASLVTGAMGNLLVEIHPIGSTAVPGLAAKPVIDVRATESGDDADGDDSGDDDGIAKGGPRRTKGSRSKRRPRN